MYVTLNKKERKDFLFPTFKLPSSILEHSIAVKSNTTDVIRDTVIFFLTAYTVCSGSLSLSETHTSTGFSRLRFNIEANIFKKPRSESE